MVAVALLLNLTMLISSMSIQMELDKRVSLDLIERLISTDLVFRIIPMILLAVTNFLMLYKVENRSNSWVQRSS